MPLPKGIADEFADLTWMPLQEWMLWKGWKGWVGCVVCAIPDDGTEKPDKAVCWHKSRCHGYHNGCGCKACDDWDGDMDIRLKAERYRLTLTGPDKA